MMKFSLYPLNQSSLLLVGLIHQIVTLTVDSSTGPVVGAMVQANAQSVQSRLIDKCCQVGKEKAIESSKFNCKLGAREALISSHGSHQRHRSNNILAESLLSREPSFADQCEMVLESCCMAHHRTRNCDSGKQFAKSGSACMDVELSKEATVATESFNDCCMSCSLGILAAKNPSQNETTIGSIRTQNSLAARCKLISPLASSLSGQLYEQTYIECCQENLPRLSSALLDPGAPIDCTQSNPCSQRCVGDNGGAFDTRYRCDCFAGYKLAQDGVSCIDIDECKLGQHSCNRQSEVCDNTRGSFRCLARHQFQFQHNSQLVKNEQDGDGFDERKLDFVPMRICPLGLRWNKDENKCQQLIENNGGLGQRSASLFATLPASPIDR